MTMTAQDSPVAAARAKTVAEAVARIRDIEKTEGVTEQALAKIHAELEMLATRKELFPVEDFPPPPPGKMRVRHKLSEDPNNRLVLYVNTIAPGKQSEPHDHKAWASIVAIEGEELNRLYKRTDDGSDPDKATLVLEREVVVRPGAGVAMMPEDIHGTVATGDTPAMQLHMYGRAPGAVGGRLGFDPETGAITHYDDKDVK